MIRWVLTLLLLFPLSANAEEQRCIDLGADCECSEPLDNNDFPTETSGVTSHNPSDSTTKACGSMLSTGMTVETRQVNHQGNLFFVTEFQEEGSIYEWGHLDSSIGAGHERICVRYYRGHSSDFPPDPSVCAAGTKYKNWEGCEHDYTPAGPGGGTSGNCQGNAGSGGTFDWRSLWANEGLMPQIDSIGPDTPGDCLTDTGCRFELCWGVTDASADIRVSAADVQADIWVTDPSTGAETQWQIAGTGSTPSPHEPGTGALGGFQMNIATTCDTGTIYQTLHHIMVATWATNSDQRIGAAIEVEGAVAATGSTGVSLSGGSKQ